ncbi:MAG: hypothetical protein ACRCW2_11570 [Cellulosilyticaceae bacterium]
MNIEVVFPQGDKVQTLQREIEKYYASLIYEVIDILELDSTYKQALLEKVKEELLGSQKD